MNKAIRQKFEQWVLNSGIDWFDIETTDEDEFGNEFYLDINTERAFVAFAQGYLLGYQPENDGTCKWTEDEDGNWFTDCGEAFTFIDGGPAENSMKFCCYCGKPLEPVEYKETEAEE